MSTNLQFSQASFLWALGSLCRLHGKPHDARLLLQRHPPDAQHGHRLSDILLAAKELGLLVRETAVHAGSELAHRLPCLAFSLNSESGGASPAILVRSEGDTLHYHTPEREELDTCPRSELAQRFGATLYAVQPAAETLTDQDGRTAHADQPFGFAWFIPELLRHKHTWRDILAASLALQLVGLATPLFTQVVIDKVVVHQTQSTLAAVGIGLALSIGFSALFGWVRQYLVLHTGNRIDAVLGSRVFDHLLKLPMSYFTHRPTGVLVARLQGVETIREFVSGAAVTLILDLPFMLVLLAVMFWYAWQLSLIALGLLLLLALLSLAVTPLFRHKLNRQFLLSARNQAFVTEHINGMETVKSLQLESQLQKRQGSYLADTLAASFETRQLSNTYNTLANTLEQIQSLAVLVAGALLVMRNDGFTIGMLVAFQMFAGRLSQPMLRLTGLYQEAQQARLAVQRLGDILNVAAEPHALIPSRALEIQGSIELDKLSYRYEAESPWLFREFSHRFRAGQTTLIMGPSGAGKSTLAKLMLGFYRPQEGRITLDGQDTRHLPANELRHHFGVVPQETILFSGILNGGEGKDVLSGDSPDNVGKASLPGGRHGDDALSGGEGDDELWGNGGHDMLSGGSGDDQLVGDDSATAGQYHGNDTLDGGEGEDQLWGNGGDDVLIGGVGDDHLEGDYDGLSQAYQNNDLLDGGEGDDELIGMGGDDDLSGGKGNDKLWGDGQNINGDDTLAGGEGDDQLWGNGGKDTLSGGDGDDEIAGDTNEEDSEGGADLIDGGKGNDTICGDTGDDSIAGGEGNDRISGGHGSDTLSGGEGNDEIAGDTDEEDAQGGNDSIDGGAGNDILVGFTGNDILSGGEGNDQLGGGKGNDILDGGEGNNVLDGGEGDDLLYGGSGDDIYYRSAGGGKDRISDSGGNDRLIIQLPTRYDLSDPDYAVKMYNEIQRFMHLGLGSLLLQFEDGGELHLDDFDPDNPYGPDGIEFFQFDKLVFTRQELVELLGMNIEGTPEADVLSGTAIDDTITALEGDDTVYGLGGADVISLDEGNDWAEGGEGGDVVFGGAGNDVLLGNAGSDWIDGGEGDDTLQGGSESDELQGGDGNDRLEGGDGADALDGGAGDDVLDGGSWADTLTGGEGNDWLAGGSGADELNGGAGDDTYEYASGWGNDLAWADAGHDTLRLSGLSLDDVQLHRQGDDLFVLVEATKERFTAVSWFDPASSFEQMALGDGSRLDRAGVEASLYNNEAPVTTPDLIVMNEHESAIVSGNVLDNDTDDHSVQGPGVVVSSRVFPFIGLVNTYSYTGKLTIENPGTNQGNYGTLLLGHDGRFSYVLDVDNPDLLALAEGQTLEDHFFYNVTDNDAWGASSASEEIRITVNGRNDPPFSAADMLYLQEDLALSSSGNVLDNDIDPDAGTVLTVLNPGIYAGTYGTLTLAADGAYTYDLANDTLAVQALGRSTYYNDASMDDLDVFSYTVSDGSTSVQDVQIVVTVQGNNDAPVLNLPAPDQIVQPGSDWLFTQSADMFVDIDALDTLHYEYQISSPDGAPTDWIAYDPDAMTMSGTAPEGAVGTIEITVVADDGMMGEGNEPGLETPDTFTLTLPAPEVIPVPDTPDSVDAPVTEVSAITVDSTDAPVDSPPEDPGTPGESPMPADILPASGEEASGAEVISSRSLDVSVASSAVSLSYAPVEVKPVYRVYIHAPLMDAGGGSCDCQMEADSIDPMLAGIAPDPVYGEGLILSGSVDAELLLGKTSDDQIGGGGGDDMLIGDLGRDRLYGEEGDDQIAGDKGNQDESGDDDFIDGGAGDDRIAGQGGNDTLLGSEGDDLIDGGEGHDLLDGNQGQDRLQGGAGSDWLRGGEDDDLLIGESGNDRLEGGDGKDTLFGGSGEDALQGGEGDDALIGGDCSDVIEGNGGNDQVSGGTGHDRIDGGEGDDALFGENCNDTLNGGAGKDQLQGGVGLDQLDGGEGDDTLLGEDESDRLFGGDGNDYLAGDGEGEGVLAGDDLLDGGAGDDALLGHAGKDELIGGDGNDKLKGGAGDDNLRGGEGDDVYFYSAGDGSDHIADSDGEDWLVLEDRNLADVEDFDEAACKLVFKDGGEIYLDDLKPDELMAQGGIDYIQFADKQVMSRQALIREFVPALGGMPEGMEKVETPDADRLAAFSSEGGDSDEPGDLSEAVDWFTSTPDFQKLANAALPRFTALSRSDGAVIDVSGEAIMAQWQAMDASLATHLAKGNGDAANDMGGGADLLNAASFLGSTSPWGRDPLSLAVSGSDIPKAFRGLNEGLVRVAG